MSVIAARHRAIDASDAWMKPGRTLQTACAAIIAEQARDSAGRFAQHPTKAEIVLKSLRKNYSPSLVELDESGSAGCGGAEIIDAQNGKYAGSEPGKNVANRFSDRAECQVLEGSNNSAPEVMSGPHPSFKSFGPIRIASALLGVAAVLAIAVSNTWMPDNPFAAIAAGGAVAGAGGLNFTVALGVL